MPGALEGFMRLADPHGDCNPAHPYKNQGCRNESGWPNAYDDKEQDGFRSFTHDGGKLAFA